MTTGEKYISPTYSYDGMALNVRNRNGGKVRDLYNSHRRLDKAESKEFDGNPQDWPIIEEYLNDMSHGKNVGGPRGERSPVRLLTIRSRMSTISRIAHEHAKKKLTDLCDDDLLKIFKLMRSGKITKASGEPYKAAADYVKTAKSFWHWYMRRERRAGRQVLDITVDLDTSREKPKFNYLTYEKFKELSDQAKFEYRVMLWVAYDSGARPSELFNIRSCDIEKTEEGYFQVTIREEASKTFGRKIKLLLATQILREYQARYGLKGEAFLWQMSLKHASQYIKRLGKRVFDIDDLSLYDLRHSSACYWLPRYKSESALKYRFGWQKSEMITYYTEWLGMKDTITQDDLIDSDEKTKLQQELEQQKKQNALTQENMAQMMEQLQRMQEQQRKMQEIMDKGLVEKALAQVRQKKSAKMAEMAKTR